MPDKLKTVIRYEDHRVVKVVKYLLFDELKTNFFGNTSQRLGFHPFCQVINCYDPKFYLSFSLWSGPNKLIPHTIKGINDRIRVSSSGG